MPQELLDTYQEFPTALSGRVQSAEALVTLTGGGDLAALGQSGGGPHRKRGS